MTSDRQLEKMINERNEFERKLINAEKEIGEMCLSMINMFNGGWDEEHQGMIDDEARRLIDKNKHYIKG